MRQFKWIEWNLQKIDARTFSAEEVKAAFNRVFSLQGRKDGSFQMFAATPPGRRIWVIWRHDREDDEIPRHLRCNDPRSLRHGVQLRIRDVRL
jgi:hypothetical protein